MHFFFKLGICIFFVLPFATAFGKLKFQKWFPNFEADLKPSWTTGDCQTVHYEYFYNRTSQQDRCGALLECILENTNEKRKTTMASAQAVLGLAAPLLASLGQSLAKISLLSSQRPMLSFLIVLGAPAVSHSRIRIHPPVRRAEIPPRKPRCGETQAVVLGHNDTSGVCFVVAAAVSNIELALDIGVRSVLAWSCNSWALPLLWILYPISLHGVCFIGHYYMIPRERGESKVERPRISNRSSWVDRLWTLEVLPTVNRERGPILRVPPTTTAILLQIVASALAFIHVVLGTMILSSLIFIGFHDTLRILARFVASALVCRGILMFELAGIREVSRATDQRSQHGVMTSLSRQEAGISRTSIENESLTMTSRHRNSITTRVTI